MNAGDKCFARADTEGGRGPIPGNDLLMAILPAPPAVEYQPIKDARTLDTLGYEALARFSANGRAKGGSA